MSDGCHTEFVLVPSLKVTCLPPYPKGNTYSSRNHEWQVSEKVWHHRTHAVVQAEIIHKVHSHSAADIVYLDKKNNFDNTQRSDQHGTGTVWNNPCAKTVNASFPGFPINEITYTAWRYRKHVALSLGFGPPVITVQTNVSGDIGLLDNNPQESVRMKQFAASQTKLLMFA